jgi:hypothetical protein
MMDKTIGIQIGPDSFVDEGTGKVLDLLQSRAAVNTIYLSTFTYDKGITGRQTQTQNLPDHGTRETAANVFHGGNFARPHAAFYKNTAIKGDRLKAPDFGTLDILEEVLPAAKKRNIKVVCSVQDGFNYPEDMPFVKDFAEVDIQGRKTGAMCFFQPDVREFWKAVVKDLCSSYPIDGILLFNERNGPLLNAVGISHSQRIDASKTTCFCAHHQQAAAQHGIDFNRARQGYLTLNEYVQQSLDGKRPTDGYYVEFTRLLQEFPEIMAYNQLFDIGKHQVLKEVYKTVKSVRKDLHVGFHIEHTNSFNPLYRASRSYEALATMADFLKVVVYNNCGGERYRNFMLNICQTVFKDVPPAELMVINNHLLNYSNEASIEELPMAGLSADYVMRETQRAKTGVQGKSKILPGIDVNIPTGKNSRKASPEDTYAATLAAFKGGADGVILSRKYSEMWLANLEAAGKAIRDAAKA